ncbi:sensor histidine kinase [Pseudoroseomonas cervicalis]|uniref:sensor histidine kinase n=1 Tax=Teichococcus cervicalis TaxID=204525 RepID=UPI002782E000|nr:PAS domain-containing sensor histidine kinase [Pseudoroseomonas cervicalis]MDQ1079628.1 two-component sensor histidine kinase [Pseudoroseomonas cervicalis]
MTTPAARHARRQLHWLQGFLAVSILAFALLLLAHRMVGSDAAASRIHRMQNALGATATLLSAPGEGFGEAWADSHLMLARLARQEPELEQHYEAVLAALMLADPPLREPVRALESGILGQIATLHRQEQERLRVSVAVALAAALAGGLLLGQVLRGALRDARAQAAAAADAKARMRAVCGAAPIGLAVLDDRLRVETLNTRFALLTGRPPEECEGLALAELLPELAPRLQPLLREALAQGQPLPGQDITLPGPGGEPRCYHVAIEPVQGARLRPDLCLALMDVSERLALAAWREEIVGELNHRVKNTLATVQSLAAQTLRGAALDPQRFAADFSARLGALSRSHELLAAVGWSCATLPAVVQAALSPWREGGRLCVEGEEPTLLRPLQAQSLVIALTELAGNAARHGALSAGGLVRLRWERGGDGLLHLCWQEQGGPPLAGPPLHRGFGLRFLERGLAHDLGPGAQVRLFFGPDGLHCEMRFPASPALPAAPPQAA